MGEKRVLPEGFLYSGGKPDTSLGTSFEQPGYDRGGPSATTCTEGPDPPLVKVRVSRGVDSL